MNEPFSINIFATTGDPEGIRHVDMSNWSGHGVVFTRELFGELKNEPGFNQAGLYILVGHLAEEYLYIGEADPVGERLKSHVSKKEGWAWGVYFYDQLNKVGKTEIKYLESSLIHKARHLNHCILWNKNLPSLPSISKPARASADVFLTKILLVLPILGIQAFSNRRNAIVVAEELAVERQTESTFPFDTIVIPARIDGFQEEFIERNRWFAIRLNPKNISKLKYIAGYQVSPVRAITHIAEIESIVPHENTGKFMVHFKGQAKAIQPIRRDSSSTMSMQSPRYTTHKRVMEAKHFDELWPSS